MGPLPLNDFLHEQYEKLNSLSNLTTFNKHQKLYDNALKRGQDVGRVSMSYVVKHPVTKRETTLNAAIIDLNDRAKWTREKIADWIDTLDEQPVFFPKIDKPLPPNGSPVYFRDVSAGSKNVHIMYACQCRVFGSSVYCGQCERFERLFRTFGHLCFECPHGDKSGDLGDPWV